MRPNPRRIVVPGSIYGARDVRPEPDRGLGWINLVIMAASAIYGLAKKRKAKKKAKKQAAAINAEAARVQAETAAAVADIQSHGVTPIVNLGPGIPSATIVRSTAGGASSVPAGASSVPAGRGLALAALVGVGALVLLSRKRRR